MPLGRVVVVICKGATELLVVAGELTVIVSLIVAEAPWRSCALMAMECVAAEAEMDVAIELLLEAVKTLTPSRETVQRVIADPPFAEHATANGDTTVPLLSGLVHDKVTEASARPTINRHNAKLSALTNLNIASPSSVSLLRQVGSLVWAKANRFACRGVGRFRENRRAAEKRNYDERTKVYWDYSLRVGYGRLYLSDNWTLEMELLEEVPVRCSMGSRSRGRSLTAGRRRVRFGCQAR